MCMIRGLVNRYRNQTAGRAIEVVVEPDPRLVMVVLSVGVVVGALFTTPSSAVPPSIPAAVADAGR